MTYAVLRRLAGVLAGLACGFVGCGQPPAELTPEQIQQQHAEDKAEMNFEDAAEAAFQKQQQQNK